MLLRDSNDYLFACTFGMELGQLLDQSSFFSHNFRVSNAGELFSLIKVSQFCLKIFIELMLHTHFFCQKLVYMNLKTKKKHKKKLEKNHDEACSPNVK